MLKENRTLGGELRNQLVATVTEMLEKEWKAAENEASKE